MAFQPGKARADVGVPPAQPGSSLSPGDFETNVQMVSEVVEINILEEPEEAIITASFQMRNNGTDDEEFDVWFPYGERFPNSKGIKIIQAKDFRAWVDGEEVEITIEKSDQWNLIWAHWKVRFPAQTPLTIQVSYRILPNRLYTPHYTYSYILETGAGWQGVIEEAEIIVKLPFEKQEMNNQLGIGDIVFARPAGYVVKNDGIEWIFTDLEPSVEDNIEVYPVTPNTVKKIQNGLSALDPGNEVWEDSLDLALGLQSWMRTREWAEDEGIVSPMLGMEEIVKIIGRSFLVVVEESPPDEIRYLYALNFFEKHPDLIGGSHLERLFNEALGYFPDEASLISDYQRAQENGLFEISDPTEVPDPTAVIIPAASPTAEIDTPDGSLPISLNLVMGLLFIAGAIVLLIIAIRRRAK
jgi:hypothetical protein